MRKTVTIITCDRCNRPAPECLEPLSDHRALAVTLPPPGEGSFNFGDLCPKCSTSVGKLLARIRLDPKDGDEE